MTLIWWMSDEMLQANINTWLTAGEEDKHRQDQDTMCLEERRLRRRWRWATHLENVTEFEYLGSLLSWGNDCGKKIRKRISKALGAMAGFKKVWISKETSVKTKLIILTTCFFSIARYKWVIETEETRQRQAEGNRDEMLQANYAHQMATYDNEWGDRRRMKCQWKVFQMAMERNMNLFGQSVDWTTHGW